MAACDSEDVTILVVGRGSQEGVGDAYDYTPGYRFVHDLACPNYDWLVVYDEFDCPITLKCPNERTIFATCEPTSIKAYSKPFTRQFGHLLTNRPWASEKHPHYHLGRGYYRWFVDRTPHEVDEVMLPPKRKVISAVCSSKQMRNTQHRARFRLVQTLAREIPDLDWYGHGVKPFGKKYEVMDPYRYQVVVENHIAPHHWSEKLSDAFLSECLPFYAGAPDLADDFPADSFIPIPIDDPDRAVQIVKKAIDNGEYEKRREAILEAKRLVRAKYNFWAQVIEIIEGERDQAIGERLAGPVTLYPRKVLRKRNMRAALEEGWSHFRQYFVSPIATACGLKGNS